MSSALDWFSLIPSTTLFIISIFISSSVMESVLISLEVEGTSFTTSLITSTVLMISVVPLTLNPLFKTSVYAFCVPGLT